MKALIKVDIQNYWHAGTGRSSGSHLDALTEKNNQIPTLAGRHLKGLIRFAFQAARQWQPNNIFTDISVEDSNDATAFVNDPVLSQLSPTELEELIFGSAHYDINSTGNELELRSSLDTFPGMLRVGSGQLSPGERVWLAENEGHAFYFYDELFSTAIDAKTGSAKDQSLRGIEVCIPTILYAEVSLEVTAQDDPQRQQQIALLHYLEGQNQNNPWLWLKQLLPMIDAVGAKRNRGLGEAQLTLMDRQSVTMQGAA